MAKKIRPLGDITSDLEPLIEEMIYKHDMQWGEVLSIIHGYLMVHCPNAREKYIEGGHPKYYYGA